MVSRYEYKTVNRLRYGQHFQFATGGAINFVVHCERNVLVYTNMITRKTRRLKGFADTDPETKTCKVRYCKIIDSLFEDYYTNRKEAEAAPF